MIDARRTVSVPTGAVVHHRAPATQTDSGHEQGSSKAAPSRAVQLHGHLRSDFAAGARGMAGGKTCSSFDVRSAPCLTCCDASVCSSDELARLASLSALLPCMGG